jgi:hypothetical protein
MTITVSEKLATLVANIDKQLNIKIGYPGNHIVRHLIELSDHGQIEVGWRESCGKTDPSHHVYRGWLRVVKQLKKEGITLTEERVKHGNAYATNKGGFWNSIIYRIAMADKGK